MPIRPGIGATSTAYRSPRNRTLRAPSMTSGPNENARRNREALKAMTQCELESGMTADQLTQHQRDLKAAMYARLETNPPA